MKIQISKVNRNRKHATKLLSLEVIYLILQFTIHISINSKFNFFIMDEQKKENDVTSLTSRGCGGILNLRPNQIKDKTMEDAGKATLLTNLLGSFMKIVAT